jgi:hypothetical protein
MYLPSILLCLGGGGQRGSGKRVTATPMRPDETGKNQ